MTAVLWPRRVVSIRMPRARVSTRVDLRALTVAILVIVAGLVIGWIALSTGSASVTVPEVWAALTGTADAGTTRIVLEWRLPRIVFALVGGAALAVSGAVFQSITRNPLGSPDIIGFSTGAYTGALLVGLLGLGGVAAAPLGALAGGILTGAAVYLLAWRRGVSGLRIIVVGIGISVFLGAFNTYLLTTMRLEDAVVAASWGAGNLGDIGWQHTVPLLIVVGLALPFIAARGRELSILEMGDDAAHALGVSGERLRIGLLVAAVALVAVVTASAGPIAFVALAAPQLAMRLTGTAGVRVLPAAAMGALLLVSCDLIARTIVAPAALPVGVVTLSVGGAYLLWLLAAGGRRRTR